MSFVGWVRPEFIVVALHWLKPIQYEPGSVTTNFQRWLSLAHTQIGLSRDYEDLWELFKYAE